jgi:hypothetical protein
MRFHATKTVFVVKQKPGFVAPVWQPFRFGALDSEMVVFVGPLFYVRAVVVFFFTSVANLKFYAAEPLSV